MPLELVSALSDEWTTVAGYIDLGVAAICASPVFLPEIVPIAAAAVNAIGRGFFWCVDRLFDLLAGIKTASEERRFFRDLPPVTDRWKFLVLGFVVILFSLTTLSVVEGGPYPYSRSAESASSSIDRVADDERDGVAPERRSRSRPDRLRRP